MAFARQRLISAPIVGKVVEHLGKSWEKHRWRRDGGVTLVAPTNDDDEDDDDSNWRREGGGGGGVDDLRGS